MVVVQKADVVMENVVVMAKSVVIMVVSHLVTEKDVVEMAVLVNLASNVVVTLAPVVLIPMEKNVVMVNVLVGET